MAAAGMTDCHIAHALFVTVRTSKVHLTHTYQKLRIHSRGELGAALATQRPAH